MFFIGFSLNFFALPEPSGHPANLGSVCGRARHFRKANLNGSWIDFHMIRCPAKHPVCGRRAFIARLSPDRSRPDNLGTIVWVSR
jgi:hypothetical protein